MCLSRHSLAGAPTAPWHAPGASPGHGAIPWWPGPYPPACQCRGLALTHPTPASPSDTTGRASP
eukprot:scaffold3055_cov96-Isochrysis_galbana.AAC.2